jgi:radical SAM protein with 4Fe4S-binding SPASM domain
VTIFGNLFEKEELSSASPLRFTLHPKVAWVKGPKNGALYDLRRGEVIPVPERFVDFFEGLRGGNRSTLPNSPFFTALVEKEILVLEGTFPDGEISSSIQETPDLSPRLLWLEITGRCNYTCIHCYADSSPGAPSPSLPSARILKLLEEARDLRFSAVQFTGGDPLMHPDLLEFVHYAHTLGFPYVEVYTNGSLLTSRHLDLFERHKTHIALSFYSSNPKTYSAITQNPRGYERVIGAIREMISRKIPFRIGVIVMDLNRDEIGDTITFLKNLGVPEEKIATDEVRPTGRGMELLKEGCNAPPGRNSGGFIPVTRLTHKPPQIFPEIKRTPRTFPATGDTLTYNTCFSGEIVVDPEGNLFPCIFSRTEPLGNVRDRPLKDLLFSSQVQSLWSLTLGSSEDCYVCEFRYACFDCRALTLAKTGRLHAKPPGCYYNPNTGFMDWKAWLQEPRRRNWIRNHRFSPYPATIIPYEEGGFLENDGGVFYLDPVSLTIWELSSYTLAEVAEIFSRLRGEDFEQWEDAVLNRALTMVLEGMGELIPPPA